MGSTFRVRRIQGWYYLVGGIWPLLHWKTFTAVAGPKPDRFQTEVTSGLFAAIGYALLRHEDEALSFSSALACLVMDRKFSKEIRPVFQADALLNAVFVAAAMKRTRRAL